MQPVYADYAAATPVDERVIKRVAEVSAAIFANPSSAHGFGHAAWIALNEAKITLANFINAMSEELYFTSSGTESNNLAILGVARANKNRGNHIITSQIEHPSILNACKALERDGFKVTYLSADSQGQISLDELKRTITEQTILVSLSYGNSEIGTLFDVAAMGAICRDHHVYFHVDACQSAAYLPIDVRAMNIDLLTLNGNKMYGPKGVALLYVRDGISIFPITYGGGQQKSLRSGTENVPGIVGLARAAAISKAEGYKLAQETKAIRDQLQAQLEKMPNIKINVTGERLPNHLSVCVENRKNADLVKEMDQEDVAVSAGSACSSNSIVDSHVLSAIGLTPQQIHSTLRITLGRNTTYHEIEHIALAIKKVAH